MITLDLASGSAFSEHARYRGTMISRIFSPCLYVKAHFQFPDPAAPDEVLFSCENNRDLVSHDLPTPLTAIRGAAFNVAPGLVREPECLRLRPAGVFQQAPNLLSKLFNLVGLVDDIE
jgi:hypothetical protein